MGCLKNIVLTVAYDGTAYKGFQNIKSDNTIESSLASALKKILNEEVALQAASRTDAGVHATCQIVNFIAEILMPLEGLKSRLNNELPSDISVLKVEEAAMDFHPTLDCVLKEYHYFVCNTKVQMPHHRLYSWHFPYSLKIELMKEAAAHLTGTLDFQAFCNIRSNHTYKSYVREIKSIEILSLPEGRICFKIKGNKFLYKMVRNIVGTLLYIGCGKLGIDDLLVALESKNRKDLGVTAKACGLSLYQVYY